jgi:VCBS repeat-containing protein
MMRRIFQRLALLALTGSLCFAVDTVTAVHGTVTKIDSGAKTIVVKTKDGTEHTLHFVG